ncbi:MAG TPA: hypothetical protein ENK18_19205 [Deltaproteobacteria bacterium]|nr:hypothetical protein [Deltaproteobacteria bacterium]
MSCDLTDNPLRARCAVSLSSPGPVTVALEAPGVPPRSFHSPDRVLRHDILAWGLVPETPYTWSVGARQGTITTGALPADLARASVITTGTAWGFDAVLYPLACEPTSYFTLIDGQGRIVWFEPNDVFFDQTMTGYEWSQGSLSVLSLRSTRFLEQHVSGQILLDLRGGVELEHKLHHDADRWGRHRYLLHEYPLGDGRNVDGIDVFDDDQLVGTFDLADAFEIVGGGPGDWSHANGLNVTDSGEIILSLLNFDTILGIDGDPASPTFLQLSWHAVGSGDGLPEPDYVPVAGVGQGFSGQHNASRHGDELWVFDNTGDGARSRALRMQMDHVAGTLEAVDWWWFDHQCSNQGGALPIEGGVLATCANRNDVWAFRDGERRPDWTLKAGCDGGGISGLDITRAIPVFIE